MKASWLIWQLTWRSALRILLLGALFGGIYGTWFLIVLFFSEGGRDDFTLLLLAQLLGFLLLAALIGAFFGVLIGSVVGVLVGLLISVITIRWFLPLHDRARYLRVVIRSSILLGGIGTFVGTLPVKSILFGAGSNIRFLLLLGVIPALLASLAIWRSSAQVAAWYVRTADAHAALALQIGE